MKEIDLQSSTRKAAVKGQHIKISMIKLIILH